MHTHTYMPSSPFPSSLFQIPCPQATCDNADCCDANPTCGSEIIDNPNFCQSDCGPGCEADTFKTNFVCANKAYCRTQECCKLRSDFTIPVCMTQHTCAAGSVHRLDSGQLACPGTIVAPTCEQNQCCLTFVKCGMRLCPPAMSPKANQVCSITLAFVNHYVSIITLYLLLNTHSFSSVLLSSRPTFCVR
jgi:hypothetical protein